MANRFYSHPDPVDEPKANVNEHNPADPFAVVDFGGCDFTSTDPAWCRRVAAAWSEAADLLEAAQARAAGKDGKSA